MKTLGIVLMVVGLTMVIFTGFNFTTKENVVDLGPIQVDKEVNHPIKWSPIVGGILFVGGLACVIIKKK